MRPDAPKGAATGPPPPQYRPRARSIASVFARTTTITLVITALIVVAAFAAWDATHSQGQRRRAIETAATSLAATLGAPLWNYETERAQKLVAATADAPHIHGVTVHSDKGDKLHERVANAALPASALLAKSAPIIFKDAFVEKTIGRVTVTAERPDFFSMLQPNLQRDLLIIGLAAAAAAIAVRIVAHKVISRPLNALTSAIAAPRADGQPQRVDFETQTEFNDLIADYNALADALAAAHKKAERRLEQVTRANDAKTRFLAMMSHELRTPLNGVLGMAQLLLVQASTERTKDYAATILSSGKALLRLINDVLDAARIEEGALDLRQEPIDLSALIEDAIAECLPNANAKGLNLITEIALPEGEMRLGDGRRIGQILSNVLENAIKFTPAGDVRLTAAFVSPDAARIEVADTGPGVPAEMREHIFERFRQADEKMSRAFGGAGLGLAISSDLLDMMDGRIGVSDAPGGGALFWIELPLPPAAQTIEKASSGQDELTGPLRKTVRVRTTAATTRH
ncbi:MAG: ATP-binding protein [Neomegalonema sp.]|nr:ATP-binding protein [Neomegalonema sp.]